MIRVSLHRGRAELRGNFTGAEWHKFEGLCSGLGAAFDMARQARSMSLDVLPAALEQIRAAGLGAVLLDPAVSSGLRGRASRLTVNVAGLDERLEPYQREGVAYLRARFAAVLADDMGLGKTLQGLQAIENPREARVLVVCPALAKAVWRLETAKWAPELRTRALVGRGSFAWPQPGELVVTNYDILPKAIDPLPDPPAGVYLILDEAHYCKGKTIRAKSTRRLVRAVRLAGGRSWGMTGTPLDNKPPDLYNICSTLGLEKEFGSWPNFIRLFGGYKLTWGYVWGKPKPSVPLILDRIMLRRKKSDVLNLPPVRYSTRPVELKRADELEIDESIRKSGIRRQDMTEAALAALAQNPHIMTARRLLAAAKLSAVEDWAAECEESDEPAVIFSAHRAPVDAFKSRPGWKVITGETNQADRAKIAEDMQAGKLKGVAGTIRAMGVAITLTRPCLAAFVDSEWTPGANQQARDRLVRIGQKRSVTVYNFVASHWVDERVAELLAEKTTRQQLTVDAITSTPDSARVAAMLRLADAIDLDHL